MSKILFIMGPTNSGKSHLIDHLEKTRGAYCVRVGKMLRDKYGAAYFKGQQAPETTRIEALRMMQYGIAEGINRNETLILVDGQPREYGQLPTVYEFAKVCDVRLLVIRCDRDVRIQRARERDKDPAALELSLSRMDRDIDELVDLIQQISQDGYGHLLVEVDGVNVVADFEEAELYGDM